jgi:hypothetical protein
VSLWDCSERDANDRCHGGRLLKPDDVALHIVVDEALERMQLRLVRTVQALPVFGGDEEGFGAPKHLFGMLEIALRPLQEWPRLRLGAGGERGGGG